MHEDKVDQQLYRLSKFNLFHAIFDQLYPFFGRPKVGTTRSTEKWVKLIKNGRKIENKDIFLTVRKIEFCYFCDK